MIFVVVAFLQLYTLVSSYDLSKSIPSLETKIRKETNISDDDLVVEIHTFVNDYGLRRSGDGKQSLRTTSTPKPTFIPPAEIELKLKIIDLMRQSLYGTQDKIRDLDPIMDKYKNDPALRMAFTFDRLEQIIIDSRRVYTLALKWYPNKLFSEQIIWYTHIVRKFFDVVYIVEHLIERHAVYIAA